LAEGFRDWRILRNYLPGRLGLKEAFRGVRGEWGDLRSRLGHQGCGKRNLRGKCGRTRAPVAFFCSGLLSRAQGKNGGGGENGPVVGGVESKVGSNVDKNTPKMGANIKSIRSERKKNGSLQRGRVGECVSFVQGGGGDDVPLVLRKKERIWGKRITPLTPGPYQSWRWGESDFGTELQKKKSFQGRKKTCREKQKDNIKETVEFNKKYDRKREQSATKGDSAARGGWEVIRL